MTGRPTRPAPLHLAFPLAILCATGAPALAQEADVTTFELDVSGAAHPPRPKPPARSRKRSAPPARAAPGRTTIPMDFSGMARRGADLDRPKEGPDPSAPEDRPVIRNGLTPGASFSF